MRIETENNKIYLIHNNFRYWCCIKYIMKEKYLSISLNIVEGKVNFEEYVDLYPLSQLKEYMDMENLEIRIKINKHSNGEKIQIHPTRKDKENLIKQVKEVITLLKEGSLPFYPKTHILFRENLKNYKTIK